ncbi:hypothetical protein B5S30_g1119 [[Candida] boidinii]|nr:hypothetical protein B5S30_g1119 [[Candida] boidinii]
MNRNNQERYCFTLKNYNALEVLGQGAYGIVALGSNKHTGQTVAIKKMEPFDSELICLRTLREIKLLKNFKHPNIISILDIEKSDTIENFTSVYVVEEFMETDLQKIIYTQKLSELHIQYLMYQLLKGIKYLHSCGVIHRDLKPGNILVNANCELKICDFGLARINNRDDKTYSDNNKSDTNMMTEYVATRWYRAPEIMLDLSRYSQAIDLWSVGCIIGEILLGEPLLPGDSYKSQLLLIFELIGSPSPVDLQFIKSERSKKYISSLRQFKGLSFKKIFKDSRPELIDLVSKLLVFNPNKRLDVDQAISHTYFDFYREPESEITGEQALDKEQFYFDDCKGQLAMIDLKRILFLETSVV